MDSPDNVHCGQVSVHNFSLYLYNSLSILSCHMVCVNSWLFYWPTHTSKKPGEELRSRCPTFEHVQPCSGAVNKGYKNICKQQRRDLIVVSELDVIGVWHRSGLPTSSESGKTAWSLTLSLGLSGAQGWKGPGHRRPSWQTPWSGPQFLAHCLQWSVSVTH